MQNRKCQTGNGLRKRCDEFRIEIERRRVCFVENKKKSRSTRCCVNDAYCRSRLMTDNATVMVDDGTCSVQQPRDATRSALERQNRDFLTKCQPIDGAMHRLRSRISLFECEMRRRFASLFDADPSLVSPYSMRTNLHGFIANDCFVDGMPVHRALFPSPRKLVVVARMSSTKEMT